MKRRFASPKILLEIVLALVACFLLATSLTVLYASYRLSKGPVDMAWAIPTVERALGDEQDGVDVHVGGIVAEWKNFDAPLTLGIAELRIARDGNTALNVKEVGLQLAKAPLFIGVISPEAVFIQDPSIRARKTPEGKISFLIASRDQNDTDTTQEALNPEEMGQGLFLGGSMGGRSALPLSNLESIVIKNAVITIQDEAAGRNFSMPEANLTLLRDSNKVSVAMDYKAVIGTEPRAKITASLTRHPVDREIRFVLDLDNVETGLWALNLPSLPGLMREDYSFDGKLTGVFALDWTLHRIRGDIQTSSNGEIRQKFTMDGERDKDTGMVPLNVSLGDVSLDQIASVWPDELKNLNVTEWFTQKLSVGTIKNFVVTLPFKNTNGKWVLSGFPSGKLDFENLTCDYRAPLYPITEGYGRATIENDTLSIFVDKAKLKNLDVSKGSVVVTHLTNVDHVGEAQVKLHLSGPLDTYFRYIALDPIKLGEKIGVNPDQIKGNADADVAVSFPTLKDLPAEQVTAIVDAKLTDTKLPGMVKGMDLSGGPFDLKVEKGKFSVGGTGQLNGSPLEFTYAEYLNHDGAPYIADVKAKVVADDAMRAKFGADLSEYVSGKTGLDVAYTEKTDGTTELKIKADLTPGQTFVKPLNYLKREGVPGSATATVFLKGKTLDKIKDLNVTIGKDQASGGQMVFGKENTLVSGSFDKVRLGTDNDFALKMDQAGGASRMTITGASIDARSFLNNSQPSATPRTTDTDVNIDTANMRMGDAPAQKFTNPKMRVVVNPKGDVKLLKLQAKAEGSDFALSLAPNAAGAMALQINSNNAGAALKVLGAYENMVGGTMTVSGTQMPGGGINDIQGKAEIKDFWIVKAPILAKLIGAFSITGLPELLSNEGISFTRLKTDFIWRQSNAGRIINLYNGATSGGSVGLTFGGVINQTKDTVDISGTFVPVSQINKIVSSIPLVGKLLTGGKNGGIIAATYALKGPSADPGLSINPLSVLAPGFLRSILFEGGMNAGKDEKPVPQPKANVRKTPN